MSVNRPRFGVSSEYISKQIENIRDMLSRALGTLRQSAGADTFLGRKTQEPSPSEDDERAQAWVASTELQPPSKAG
ncbi:hypothetical protein ACQR1W_16400 [Bradyrhizobium sp. HKCCYLS1011]|uniref:hypothetical protein n=1 Tax=Bradyrhizobium sp. HKCCYLS1011 TaxID=3420733 RepID=UPI003EB76223